MHVRVSGVIIKEEAVLLVRHDHYDGQLWHLPGGGINDHETLTAALEREFAEELTLRIVVDDLWLVCNSIRPDGVNVLHCVFWVRHLAGTPRLQAEYTSAAEWRWVHVNQLSGLRLYPHIPAYLQTLTNSGDAPQTKTIYAGFCPAAAAVGPDKRNA